VVLIKELQPLEDGLVVHDLLEGVGITEQELPLEDTAAKAERQPRRAFGRREPQSGQVRLEEVQAPEGALRLRCARASLLQLKGEDAASCEDRGVGQPDLLRDHVRNLLQEVGEVRLLLRSV